MRIAVVGAGIIGVNAALALQARGAEVVLFDRAAPGQGASFGNAGCFAFSEVTPISMPGLAWSVPGMLADPHGPLAIRWSYLPRLAPWLMAFLKAGRSAEVARISDALSALCARAKAEYAPLLAASGAEALVRREGALFVFRDRKALEAELPEWEMKRARGITVEEIGPERLREMEPALSPDYTCAFHVPDWHHTVNPEAIVTTLAAHFRSKGGRLRRAEVDRIEDRPERLRLKPAGAPAEPFDRIVIACGAHSLHLCAPLGYKPLLDTERGYNLTLPDPQVTLTRPVCVMDKGYFMTPMEMGLRVGGGVELGGLAAAPNWDRPERMVSHAETVLPGLNRAGGAQWMGFRPSMPDSLPVIGKMPGHERLLVAFGHGHMGLTLGAVTGRLLSEIAFDAPPCVDPAPYDPARFA
ncbi:NAD(P)/FAD-dependent oxidoreductase [Pseudooceanicola nanhaiensis]|uniref:NAD(P)/FAD-dependent oxidoreductase n=1 Tax=Pseudooceanicola nanhaiensis TaxID=375761 RepID=UPI001CD7691C|nr:FAD-dependent oxidoreductase [Pseudooceanicola nanhaiensis]MCA0921871.1 FAD-binding oxidoreductase [Pseudooceanicola nanhaiensis]